MTNQLLITLKIIQSLEAKPATSADLMAHFSISVAGLRRHIAEARLIGAPIESVRSGKGWVYTLQIPASVRLRVANWIELEEKRDLTA